MPPVRHRARRVEARRFRKRAARFGVIEPIREVEALIDEQLRARRFRRDFEDMCAELLQPRREHTPRSRLVRRSGSLVVLVVRRLGKRLDASGEDKGDDPLQTSFTLHTSHFSPRYK